MEADVGATSTPGGSSEIAASISGVQSDRKVDERPEDTDNRTILPLVERARSGDKDAFGLLYRRFHSRVFGLARFYLGDGAEDAVAETFTRAWAALPRYKPGRTPFISWLYGIGRHVVVDELRRRKRTELRDALPDSGHEPNHDDTLALAAAIDQLPRQQRQVIEMKYLLGMTNPEVSAALGKKIGAVNAQQWRALQTLKKILGRT
ncbi:MAG TPA: sigma-70 family RNA polymerase sigma factor [Actinomycetota bacterium]|nr:sigma-70 family RNA polymerase sigma factor [Actinomycetota bacterium]